VKLALAAALAAVWVPLASMASPIVREAGAIYLSDFQARPLRLKVQREAPCYFDINLTRFAGMLRFPQTVQAEAFSEFGARIRGNARQGGVAAWVPYADLEPLPENFLADLRKASERKRMVDELIAQNEVAIGMTESEVLASIGRPQKKTKRADKTSTSQIWEYIKYELVPQTTYGPSFTQTVVAWPGATNLPAKTIVTGTTGLAANTVYVKVPVGKLAVSFSEGLVESIDQTEGTLAGARATIVAPPINLVW